MTPVDTGPLLRIVSIVFPIFAVIAIGWLYARYRRTRGGIDMAFANELNMDVFVPALVISAMVSKSFDLASYQWLALGAVLVMLGSGVLAWGLAILLREEANLTLAVGSKFYLNDQKFLWGDFAAAMALGVVLVRMAGAYNLDLMGYLFGSILALSWTDVVVIAAVAAPESPPVVARTMNNCGRAKSRANAVLPTVIPLSIIGSRYVPSTLNGALVPSAVSTLNVFPTLSPRDFAVCSSTVLACSASLTHWVTCGLSYCQ